MLNWASFMTYAVVTAVTPGPNNIASMSNGNRKGFRKSLPFNFGILAGFAVVMIVCTIFCQALSALIPKIKLPMMIAGTLYMLYLAWETYRSGTVQEGEGKENGGGFKDGLLLQFVNVKIYIYGILSMEAYILPYYSGNMPALLFFALLLAIIGFIFTLVWTAFGAAFRKIFSRHARTVNTILALLLVYCAVSLFIS